MHRSTESRKVISSTVTPTSSAFSCDLALGGFYTTLASLAGALMAALVKWGSHAFSTEFLITVRFGSGLLAFLAITLISRRVLPYRASHPWLCLLVAGLYVSVIFCLYLAIRYIPLSDAVLLLTTAPLFAPVINRIWLKKQESPAVWLGIGLGFAGVVIVLRPDAELFQVHALIGLMSGLLLAVRMVVFCRLAGMESKETITFYALGAGSLFCVALLALTGLHVANWEHLLFPPRDWLRPLTIFPMVTLAVVALGMLALLQPWFVAAGYEHASVGQVSPFRYTGVVFAGLLDWLFWGQIPDLHSVIGFLLITASGVWVIRQAGRK